MNPRFDSAILGYSITLSAHLSTENQFISTKLNIGIWESGNRRYASNKMHHNDGDAPTSANTVGTWTCKEEGVRVRRKTNSHRGLAGAKVAGDDGDANW
jgi:hypothetical protein